MLERAETQEATGVDRSRLHSTRTVGPEPGLHWWMNRHIFAGMKTFAQVLDWADELGVEEQESLVEVLQRRLAERRREALIEAVTSARREFGRGRCRPATPNQIVKRILA